MSDDDRSRVVAEWLAAFERQIAPHGEHTWEQVGRCVYCADCAVRLYQGTVPASHPKVAGRRARRQPQATTDMRRLWDKD